MTMLSCPAATATLTASRTANPLPGDQHSVSSRYCSGLGCGRRSGGPALCASDDSATRAPPWNASLRSQFDFPAFAGTTGFVRGLYTYYAENDNGEQDQNFVVDAYGVLNLYLGLRSDSGAWEVTAFAKNVLEDDTLLSFSDDFVPTGVLNINPTTSAANPQPYFPQTVQYKSFSVVTEREIGLTIRFNFGR